MNILMSKENKGNGAYNSRKYGTFPNDSDIIIGSYDINDGSDSNDFPISHIAG